METLRSFGEARSYDDLHEIVRVVASEREITRDGLDEIAGLQRGYAGKLLAPAPVKRIGPLTLEPILSALGIKLVVVEDPEALRRFGAKMEACKAVKPVEKLKPIPREFRLAFQEEERARLLRRCRRAGKKGGKALARMRSKSERQRVASHGGRACWQSTTLAERQERMAKVRAAKTPREQR